MVPLAVVNAPMADAAPSGCRMTIDNGLLHPTATLRCNGYSAYSYYRAEARCWPGYMAYGSWERTGASTARCFFTNVTAAWRGNKSIPH